MTRETKISLLVGLAFIIVIGILLSDHFRSTQELPRAVLAEVGSAVRRATDVPGESNQGLSFVSPTDSTPRQSVPTRDELTTPQSPVVPTQNYRAHVTPNNPPPAPEDHGADMQSQSNPIADAARRNGEAIEPANMNGTPRNEPRTDDQTSAPIQDSTPGAVAPAPRQYKAGDGDTVSHMAAKFLGGNTRTNRQAIIDANPSLQEDPDRVVVGRNYIIPVPGSHAAPDSNDVANSHNTVATATGAYYYTVQEGDSLWQIANDQLGDPSAVDAIKEINSSVLKGESHDVVIPGMRLRLPAKPVADTNN